MGAWWSTRWCLNLVIYVLKAIRDKVSLSDCAIWYLSWCFFVLIHMHLSVLIRGLVIWIGTSRFIQNMDSESEFPDNLKSYEHHTPISHLSICLLNSKFAWFQIICSGWLFSHEAGGMFRAHMVFLPQSAKNKQRRCANIEAASWEGRLSLVLALLLPTTTTTWTMTKAMSGDSNRPLC